MCLDNQLVWFCCFLINSYSFLSFCFVFLPPSLSLCCSPGESEEVRRQQPGLQVRRISAQGPGLFSGSLQVNTLPSHMFKELNGIFVYSYQLEKSQPISERVITNIVLINCCVTPIAVLEIYILSPLADFDH